MNRRWTSEQVLKGWLFSLDNLEFWWWHWKMVSTWDWSWGIEMYNHSLVMRTRQAGSYSATALNKADVWKEAQTREPWFLDNVHKNSDLINIVLIRERSMVKMQTISVCVCMIYWQTLIEKNYVTDSKVSMKRNQSYYFWENFR